MEQIKKHLKLSKDQYYESHLSIVNCILPVKLTPTEISVLAAFMSLNGDIGKDRFGTTARKMVKKKLGISASGLSNYLRDLKNKEFLLEEKEKEYTILPLLFPEEKEQLYLFKLVNEG